jgi:iron only hydrogenase large subunit-like protein
MSGFSAAVKIGDLDDFLSPAVDCVILPAQPEKKSMGSGVIKPKSKDGEDQVASITLSDCLACSGCVTSAETLLLQSQSVEELLSVCQGEARKTICFTVSSASRRSLSEHLQVSPDKLLEFLETRLSEICHPSPVLCIDSSVAEAIVVNETVNECSEAKGLLLTSHCPGWTCYATKVLDETILPFLSRVKSPEQVIGLIMKGLLPAWNSVNIFRKQFVPCGTSFRVLRDRCAFPNLSRDIHHVLIAPCFDKKLEIIRPDYTVGDAKGVDLVLSSTEFLDLLSRAPSEAHVDVSKSKSLLLHVIGLRSSWAASCSDCESGGYVQAAASSEFSNSEEIEWKQGRNKDLYEFKKYLRSNGFRNIQNVTRRIKSGKLEATTKFVEVMACPGGCPRGGGQPVKPTPSSDSKYQNIFERVFFRKSLDPIDPNKVDTICLPKEYGPAKLLKAQLVTLLGSEEKFVETIRTEWKTLAKSGDITVSSLKW